MSQVAAGGGRKAFFQDRRKGVEGNSYWIQQAEWKAEWGGAFLWSP